MKKMYYVALATLVAAFSCAKEANLEKEQAPVQGHAVTLGVEIPATKIAYSNPGNAIHPVWQDGDKIEVVFGTTSEIFTLASGAGTQSATFTNGSSKLKEGTEYAVYYPSKDYDWSVQDGTLANLPNYLVKTGLNSLTASINLEPQLTYFVLDLNNGEAKDLSLGNAFFYNATAPFVVDSEAHTGEIKITPAAPFSYTAGVSTNATIYVAVKTAGSTTGNTLGIDMQNGDHYAGVEGYSLTWDAGKDYAAANAYTKTSSASDLKYNSGLLGKETNDAEAHSTVVTVNKGEQLNIHFINYRTSDINWDNWRLNITDNDKTAKYHIRADVYNDVTANTGVFSDNYGTAGAWGDAGAEWYDKRWPVFRSMMNGADVNLNLNFSSTGKVFVSAIATSTTGQKYVETFTANDTFGSDVLKADLVAWWSHAIIKSISKDAAYESFTVTPKTGYSKTYYALTDAVYFDKASVDVRATKADATETVIDNDLVSYTTLPASASTTASVTANFGGLAQQTVSNLTVIIGNAQAGGTDCASLFNWGNGTPHKDLANGKTATIKLMLYSGMRENYHTALVYLFDNTDTEKAFIRMDNAYLQGGDWKNGTHDWNWTTFKTAQNHSDITITIKNKAEGKADVTYDVTYANGETHKQEYTDIVIGTDDIKYNLNTEHSCVVIYSESIN